MEQSRQFSSKPASYPTLHCCAVVLKTTHAVCCMKSECHCSYLLSLCACSVNRSAGCSSVCCWSRCVRCPIKPHFLLLWVSPNQLKILRITTLIFLFLATKRCHKLDRLMQIHGRVPAGVILDTCVITAGQQGLTVSAFLDCKDYSLNDSRRVCWRTSWISKKSS